MPLLNNTQQVVGTKYGPQVLFPAPVRSDRAPTTNDVGQIGQIWIQQQNPDDTIFIQTKRSTDVNGFATATWTALAGGTGIFNSITVGPGLTDIQGAFTGTTGIFTGPLQVDVLTVISGVASFGTAVTGFVGFVNMLSSSNNTASAQIRFRKSRLGATIITGDELGSITFEGNDAAGPPIPIVGAEIRGVSTGVIAANQVPGILQFYTANAAGALTLRADIDETGLFSVRSDIEFLTATTGVIFQEGPKVVAGAGDPNAGGGVTAPQGSLYLRTDGTGVADRMWVNTDSGTTWTSVTTAA